MRDTNQELEMGAFDERRLEIENRIKNLFWTVSGMPRKNHCWN